MTKRRPVLRKTSSPDIDFRVSIQDLLDALPFYALLVDETHHILMANSLVQAHLGVKPADVIGKYCPQVIHGLDSPFPGCPLEEAVERGKAVAREFLDTKMNRWLLSAIYPTRAYTSDGRRIYFHMVTDITDRKRAEEELTSSHQKLHRLTADLESLREEERRKIARDLHDETSQLLASLSAHLEAAVGRLPPASDKVRKILRDAQSLSINIIEQLQRITYELRPLVLDDLGLIPAIGWLIDNNLKTAGIAVDFRTRGTVRRLDHQVETTVFRIIQEAVNNIVRHARAATVGILLYYMKKYLEVTITDDGQGFNPEEALSTRTGMRGLGLLGMKERIELVNGEFSLTSQPGRGTRISFKIALG